MIKSREPERRGAWAAKRVAAGRAARKLRVRVTGFRRVPTSLAGGVVGFGLVIYFFVELNRMGGGSTLRLLGFLAVLGIFTALVIWAVVRSPIRARFDQRWKPRRKVAPLDLEAWKALSDEIGGPLTVKRGMPRIVAGHRDVAARLGFVRLGGARTVAAARLPFRAKGVLTVRPRRAVFTAKHERRTGDPEFDAEFRVESRAPSLLDVLTPEARAWITAVEPDVVRVSGHKVTACRTAFVSEPDTIRGLLELTVSIARSRA